MDYDYINGPFARDGATVYKLTPGDGMNLWSAHVSNDNHLISKECCEKVAQLFTAAPDLLEALTNLLGECYTWIPTDAMNPREYEQFRPVIDAAESAVKKAQGEK